MGRGCSLADGIIVVGELGYGGLGRPADSRGVISIPSMHCLHWRMWRIIQKELTVPKNAKPNVTRH